LVVPDKYLELIPEISAVLEELRVKAIQGAIPHADSLSIQSRSKGGSHTGRRTGPSSQSFRFFAASLLEESDAFAALWQTVARRPDLESLVAPESGFPSPKDEWRGLFLGGLARVAVAYFNRSGFRNPIDVGELAAVIASLPVTTSVPPRVVLVQPLLNIELEASAVDLPDGITLRQATDQNVEDWAKGGHGEGSTVPDDMLLAVWTYAETSFEGDGRTASADQSGAEARMTRIIPLLQLAIDADVHGLFTQTLALPDRDPIAIASPGLPPRGGRAATLTTAGTATFARMWEHSDRLEKSALALAVRRWLDASRRDRDDDRLLDHWVLLEALYLPDTTAELSFRASARIAAFLGESPAERQEVFGIARDSYDCRSRLVHGSSTAKYNVPRLAGQTRTLSRRTLVLLLESDAMPEPWKAEEHFFL
jgi:hypothetical protein